MKLILSTILFLSIGLSFISAGAVSLDEARSKNQVSELPTGYLKANDDSVNSFVEDINAKRRAAYEGIAKKNGLTVEQVASKAAEKIQNQLKSSNQKAR